MFAWIVKEEENLKKKETAKQSTIRYCRDLNALHVGMTTELKLMRGKRWKKCETNKINENERAHEKWFAVDCLCLVMGKERIQNVYAFITERSSNLKE